MDRFGQKLRHLRTDRGMTLKDLAVRLGYRTHGYLSEVESGKKMPTATLALKVSKVFGVTTDQLLKDELEIEAAD